MNKLLHAPLALSLTLAFTAAPLALASLHIPQDQLAAYAQAATTALYATELQHCTGPLNQNYSDTAPSATQDAVLDDLSGIANGMASNISATTSGSRLTFYVPTEDGSRDIDKLISSQDGNSIAELIVIHQTRIKTGSPASPSIHWSTDGYIECK